MERPCIRGLKEFKKGCPEKYWDGSKGCPAWKEYTIPQADGKPVIIRDCVDVLREHWAFESLRLMEGNQAAIESLRNKVAPIAGQIQNLGQAAGMFALSGGAKLIGDVIE